MGEDRTHTGEHGTKNHTKKVDDAGSCERSNRNARILAGEYLPYRGRLWILIHGIPPARTLPISTQSFIVQLDAAAPRHLIACQGA